VNVTSDWPNATQACRAAAEGLNEDDSEEDIRTEFHSRQVGTGYPDKRSFRRSGPNPFSGLCTKPVLLVRTPAKWRSMSRRIGISMSASSTTRLVQCSNLRASIKAMTPRSLRIHRKSAVVTVDGQHFPGNGKIQGDVIASYDADYRAADAAKLAVRLASPFQQMTLSVGGQTVLVPMEDFNSAFALLEKCYPLRLGHPLVWR
jgi:hypothetical protein